MTRNTVTAASRIMLPSYVIAFCWFGAGWMFGDRTTILENPALRFADHWLPIHWWGALLVTCGLLIFAAMLSHRRTLCRLALWIAAIAMGVFVVVFATASLNGHATPGAASLFYLAAAACVATERSLLKGEVQ